MIDSALTLSKTQTRARRVLASHVRHDVGFDHLFGSSEGIRKTARLHVRKVQLPKQHDARGAVEMTRVRQAALSIFSTGNGGPRERGFLKHQLGAQSLSHAFSGP